MKVFNRPGSPNYYVRLFAGGRERLVSLRTPSRREAEARAARLKYADLPAPIRAAVSAPAPGLADLWQDYAATAVGDLKPSTFESYYSIYARFLAWSGGRPATADRVTAALAEAYLKTIPGARTANLARTVLSRIWRAGGLPDPWGQTRTRAEHRTPTRALDAAQLGRLLQVCPPDWRDLVLVGAQTGLRLTDLVHLRGEQVQGDHLELRPAKTMRSGRAVYIPLHPQVREVLARRPRPWLFPAHKASYDRCRQSVTAAFRRLLVAAELPASGPDGRVGFHSLRASFATRATAAGVPVETLRGILGHASPAMTRHYVDAPGTASLAALPALPDRIKNGSKRTGDRHGRKP